MIRLNLEWGETAKSLFRRSIRIENRRLRERYLALALVASGRSLNQVAEEVGRQRQTVGNWIRQFNEEGLEGLEPGFGKARQPRLLDTEFEALKTALEKPPKTFGFSTIKWRSWQAAQYIEQTFGKQVHPETARRYLVRLACELSNEK